MAKKNVPVHTIIDVEADDGTCRVLKLNKPNKNSLVEAHRHNYFEILLFQKGGGTHMIDFDTHSISGKTVHFVSPGQIHALNRDLDVVGYVILFTKDFMLMNSTDISILNEFPAFNKTSAPVLAFSQKDFQEIEKIIMEMESEHVKEHVFKGKILASYIGILLLKLKALLTEAPEFKRKDLSSQELMQRFNNLLEEKFISLHKVNEYAELLNVTPNHLSETIKKITGLTAGEIIHNRIILEAKRLLLHSTISAKEIAYGLNFNDPSYFSRFFKVNTGKSPEGFRKEIREKYQH